MKFLDLETRLDMARAATAVLRGLQIKNGQMTYGELAKAIGMIKSGERWEAWHRNQIGDILKIIRAVEVQSGSAADNPIEFEKIVTAEGEPGTGIAKNTRIVSD
ncbi:MAG: hypothetical protein ACJ8EL_22200 [Rhizomicrobium sp.]